LILALVLGSAAALAAGALYAAGDLYIPIIYLNLLLGAGLGFVLAATSVALLRVGRVRSDLFTYVVVLAVTLVGYYAAWTMWLWLLLLKADEHPTPYWLFMHPVAVLDIAKIVNDNGTWSMSESDKTPVTGIFLLIVWICEAGVIFIAAWWTARKMSEGQTFCESCNRWCGKPRRLGAGPMRDVNEVRQKLEQGQFESLAPFANQAPDPRQWLAYYHHTCPGCGQLNTLTVKTTSVAKNRKGKTITTVKTVIDRLLLHPGEAELLLGRKPEEPTEPTPTPSPPAA